MRIWPNFYLAPPEKVVTNYRWKQQCKEWLQTILYVVVIYLTCTSLLFEPYQIPSGSMEPTLYGDPNIWIGDRVIASKWISKRSSFKRGDIIIFISAEDNKTFIVKRLVGLPGDTIEVRKDDSRVWINGKPQLDGTFLEREYVADLRASYAINSPYKVPQDCFFVMGDNNNHSNDSRFWGPLPKDKVLGKAVLIFWPIPHARILK